jgi:hypothetical protein
MDTSAYKESIRDPKENGNQGIRDEEGNSIGIDEGRTTICICNTEDIPGNQDRAGGVSDVSDDCYQFEHKGCQIKGGNDN